MTEIQANAKNVQSGTGYPYSTKIRCDTRNSIFVKATKFMFRDVSKPGDGRINLALTATLQKLLCRLLAVS